jgi:hypothetical protein
MFRSSRFVATLAALARRACYGIPVMNRFKRAQRAELARLNRNAHAAAERIENSLRREPLRAALAEAELTGDRKPIEDFVKRFERGARCP